MSQEAQPFNDEETQIAETQDVGEEEDGMQHLQQNANVNVNALCGKRLQQNAEESFRAFSDYEAKRQRLSRIEKTMEELDKQKNELQRGIKTTKTQVQNEETRIQEALRLCFERQTENRQAARKIIAQECELAELQKEIDETAANMNKCRREIQDL